MMELTRGDPVILPDGRRGVILLSRGEERTVVGFEDGSQEQIPRSALRPATKKEFPARTRGKLERAHAAKFAGREHPQTPPDSASVELPDGRIGTVLRAAGRAGVVVAVDGEEVQLHRAALKSA